MTRLREAMIWMYLENKNKGCIRISETEFFQPSFKLFLQALIFDFSSVNLDFNRIKLSCTLKFERNKKKMSGFTDIFVSTLEERNIMENDIGQKIDLREKASSVIVVEEAPEEVDNIFKIVNCVSFIKLIKPFELQHSAAAKPKGQLFVQTEAIGVTKQLHNTDKDSPIITKSLLTDLFAITLCLKSENNFFMEPRVMSARSYLIRILFSFCKLNKTLLEELRCSVQTVKVVDDGKPQRDIAINQTMKNPTNATKNQKLQPRSKNDENNTKNNHKKNAISTMTVENTSASSNRIVLGVLTESALNRWNNYLKNEKKMIKYLTK